MVRISDLFIEAFLNEAFCNPGRAIEVAHLAATYNIGNFVSAYTVQQVILECDSSDAMDFLSAYLSTAAYLLTDHGFDPQTVFARVACSVIPFKVDQEVFLGGEAQWEARFKNQTAATERLLLNNPLMLCLVILRLNMEKIMLTLNSLGEFNAAIAKQTE